jgi:hypothetical protein
LNAAEFIEDLMEEERTGAKSEAKVIEEVNIILKMTSLLILKINSGLKRLNGGRKNIKNRS